MAYRYRQLVPLLILGALLLTSQWLAAADTALGKRLHDAKCMGCHDTQQYTRANRIVHTFAELQARVAFCDSVSDAKLSASDMDAVIGYLNANFYQFPEQP